MSIEASDHQLTISNPAVGSNPPVGSNPAVGVAADDAWSERPANRGVLLMGPPAALPIDDELAAVEDAARGIEVEVLRDRLIGLINGTGPGIVLQPVIHIQSGAHVGAEALARFPGSMTTADWFRTAHALDVGEDLELRILDEVIRGLDRRDPGFVGVNLSASVLLDPRAMELLRRAADAELVIEITEQTDMPKLSVLRNRLDEVRRLGIRVAIHVSEFGLATMQTLMSARPDVVKLDPPITAAVAAGRARSTSASNLFTFCRQEGAFVVAVGVETREQLDALQHVGVDAYQGFLAPEA